MVERDNLGFLYFDESIHNRADFILGSYVYSERDVSPLVNDCLVSLGLKPGQDEFKSSSRMIENEKQRKLRGLLKRLLGNVKLGLVVIPSTERENLGMEALKGLRKISYANGLTEKHLEVYFDKGIVFKNWEKIVRELSLEKFCKFNFNQDSRKVGGIQLADLVAHTLSIMLLETLGLISKKVKAGKNSGYDPDLDIELGFELWSCVRYNFFTQDQINLNAGLIEGFTLDTASYAVHIAPSCSNVLNQAVKKRFGSTYIGCIH